jgi:1,4-dihydroxy-2-naphthoate octaprenyltransferase
MIQPIINWVQASRLPSVVNTFIPLLYGVSFTGKSLESTEFFGLLCTAFLFSLFIVYLNDSADEMVDNLNKDYTLYSGGSRVIPEGKIKKKGLIIAGITVATLLMFVTVFVAIVSSKYLLILFPIVSVFLLYAYSFPPIKLNYRGGGEILQGIGCGIVLPIFGYMLFSNDTSIQYTMIFPYFLLHIASSIGTSLPDAKADKIGGKKTVAVQLSTPIASITAAIIIIATSISIFFFIPLLTPTKLFFCFMFPIVFSLIQLMLTPKLHYKTWATFISGMLPVLSTVSFSLGYILP